MSNYVFPMALPGIGLKLSREQSVNVTVQESASGRELRSTWWSQPRTKYKLSIDFLRSTSALMELQQVLRFFVARLGMWDSFLIADPEDNAAAACGFGVGNASTLAFQLQRTLGGCVYDKLGGPWSTASTPRTNLCLQSQTFANASWTKTNTGSITNTIAPDGTATGAGYTSSGTATITQSVAGLTASASYLLSGWARCAAGTTLKIGTTEATSSTLTIGSTWQRISLAFTAGGTSTTVTLGAASSWTTGVALEFWGFQVESTAAAIPSVYIPTVASAVTVNPSYWPAVGDGFEPIYDAQGATSIYAAGALKTLTADYTLSATGLVTFGAAPASGAALTWTGSYLRRVRFASPSLNIDRTVAQMWKAGGVELVSVIP